MINFDKYRIDSGHFYIDINLFKRVNIPTEIIWTDSDTGQYINTIRASGIPLNFRASSFRIAKDIHRVPIKGIELNQGRFKEFVRVGIYASSKVAENYFEGLQKTDFVDILNEMKERGWVDFDNAENLVSNIRCSDLDIKVDYKFSNEKRTSLNNWFHRLKTTFSGKSEDDCKVYSNAKNGMGISAYERKGATEAKPFHKFYNKSIEVILPKNELLYKSFSDEIKAILRDNMVIRYEMTFKNKDGLKRFGIDSNMLTDILSVTNERWIGISTRLLIETYHKEVFTRPEREPNELTAPERPLVVLTMNAIKNIKWQAKIDGYEIQESEVQMKVLDLFLEMEETKQERYKQKQRFDRIYHFATKSYPIDGKFKAEEMQEWDAFFGLK